MTLLPTAVCEELDARITIGDGNQYYDGDTFYERSYYIDDALAIGRIELCVDGVWSAICENVWTKEDASVACKQLGFSSAGTTLKANLAFSLPYNPCRSNQWRSTVCIGCRKQ